jgi:hypothetical protein
MFRRVVVVRTDVSKELSASISSAAMQRASFVVTANGIPILSILITLMIKGLRSPETSILTRAAQRNIPEDGISVGTNVKTSNLTNHVLYWVDY